MAVLKAAAKHTQPHLGNSSATPDPAIANGVWNTDMLRSKRIIECSLHS